MKIALLIAAIVLGGGLAAHANVVVNTGFDSPPLDSSLMDAASAYTISGGVIQRTSSGGPTDRRYIATVDSDYFSSPADFVYEVSFTNPNGTLQFIGIGTGAPNPLFSNEPGPTTGFAGSGTGALNFRIHGPNVPRGESTCPSTRASAAKRVTRWESATSRRSARTGRGFPPSTIW